MSKFPRGKVIRIYNNLFDVLDIDTYKKHVCFKKKNIPQVVVGDNVEYAMQDQKGLILEVFPQKSLLTRPLVANIDYVFLVVSIKDPIFNFFQIDSFLAFFLFHGIEVKIVLNKIDLANAQDWDVFSLYEELGYEIISMSALNFNEQDWAGFYEKIEGRTIALVGNSGVGKSTLLGRLCPHLDIKAGEISEKIRRGKQTTKQATLYYLEAEQTFVVDTPGLSFVDVTSLDLQDCVRFFPEFKLGENKCKYNNCLHLNEPSCVVKEALETGKIAKSRYDSYKKMQEFFVSKRKY